MWMGAGGLRICASLFYCRFGRLFRYRQFSLAISDTGYILGIVNYVMEGTMTKQMTARYNGKCSKCHEAIRVGDAIIWNSEAHSSRHAECPTASAAMPKTATRYSDSDSRSSLYWTARYDDERYH
jgi:hypothetical protein